MGMTSLATCGMSMTTTMRMTTRMKVTSSLTTREVVTAVEVVYYLMHRRATTMKWSRVAAAVNAVEDDTRCDSLDGKLLPLPTLRGNRRCTPHMTERRYRPRYKNPIIATAPPLPLPRSRRRNRKNYRRGMIPGLGKSNKNNVFTNMQIEKLGFDFIYPLMDKLVQHST